MSDRILVSTRKGLAIIERQSDGWAVASLMFPGVPVTAALCDPRDGTIYAALKHGHFGPKLHRSQDGGRTFVEIATPAFPPDTPDAPSLNSDFHARAGRSGAAGQAVGRRGAGRAVSLR